MLRPSKRIGLLTALGLGAIVLTALAAPAPSRHRLDLVNSSGTTVGYIVFTETAGPYLQHVLNINGQVTSLSGSTRGLTIRYGTCATGGQPAIVGGFTNIGPHVAAGGQSHPSHLGDLPDLRIGSTGTFSITKATNRFSLAGQPGLDLFSLAGGPIVAVVESAPDDGSGNGSPLLCGAFLASPPVP